MERSAVYCQRYWRLVCVLVLAPFAASQNPEKNQLVGVGATTPLAVYSKWFQAFEKARPDPFPTKLYERARAHLEVCGHFG